MKAVAQFKGLLLMLVASLLLIPAASARQDHTEPTVISDPERDDGAERVVSEARLDRVLAEYDADESLQRERPEWELETTAFEPPPERSRPHPILQFIADVFRAIGSALGYLLAAIILIGILAGLYMVFGESMTLRGRQKEKGVGPDVSIAPDLRPERAHARALLEDADALAAEGRFAEAVHLLLFRSIDDIQEKRAGLIGTALTAREIGALDLLPDTVRKALSPIVSIVERSFFGGRAVDAAGWSEARQSYEAFAFGEAWA